MNNWYVKFYLNSQRVLMTGLFAIVLTLPACFGGGDSGGSDEPSSPVPPKPTCSKPYSKIALPVEIKKNGDLYFSIDDFAILEDKNFQIDSMVLEGTLVNQKHKREEIDEFSLSLNGTKLTRNDGKRHAECADEKELLSSKSKFRIRSHLNKFFLHGGQSLVLFMLKIKAQKGLVKISLHGSKVEILDAHIVFTGWDLRDCHNPPPPPPPPAPVKPNVQIDGALPADAVTASTSMAIQFSSDQAGVTFNCSLDGATAAACSSPASFSGLANGIHNFSVTATNAAGLTSDSASHSWTVDALPPQVTIDNLASLSSLTSSSSVSFAFSSNESGTFKCSLDGADAQPCVSPQEYSGLSEGTHQFLVYAVDGVGNQSDQPASFQWMIDRTPPVASIVSVVPAQAISNSNSLTAQFAANESATFECSVDRQSFQACSSPMTVGSLTEGEHWFDVRATDLAGNVGLVVSYSWSVDLTAPEIQLVNVVPMPGLTNSPHVSVDFDTSEISEVTCQFDDGSPQLCTSPFTAEIGEGQHTLSLVAKDAAGNSSAPTVINWTADFSSPIIGFGEILPSAAAFINSPDFSAEIVANEDVTFNASLNGVSLGILDSPIVLNGLADGNYELSVTAVDRVGNAGNTINHSFTVDLVTPVAHITSAVGAITNLDANTLILSANEEVQFSCNVDETGFAPCASPLNLSGLADGLHTVQLRALDRAGNASEIVSVQWTVDTVAPETSLIVTASDADPSSFSIELISSEANSTFLCSLDGAPEQPCVSPVALSGLQPGVHSLVVRATDAAGNTDPAGATALMDVVLPIDTTLVSASPSAALTNQRMITFTFTSNHDDATFVCSLDGLDSTSCMSPQSYSDLTDGEHTFTVQAVDRFGNADESPASYTWNIDATSPTTTLAADQTARDAITFTFSANEAGSQFSCSMDGSSFAACTSPKSYSGLSTGSHTFIVKATDAAGNTENPGASYGFTVLAPITTMLNNVVPSATLTTQTSKTFTFSSNHANATFLCSLDGAPFTACTSPKAYSGLSNGAHSFRVRAVDQWGGIDTTGKTHNWTIDNVAPTVSNASTSVTSTTITVTWTTNEPATTKLNWGAGSDLSNTVPEDTSLTTSHSVVLTGLARNTLYSVQPAGRDAAGNQYTGTVIQVRTAR